ncbi:hypothetical protein [uncultured Draconibacterium sp.]|uniref:hypothetical protein n=1 Tax=uncultured Draconibacterium sp. TaxID=1573823 RepID=UPI0025CE9C33|nr:hypothetical protein [uncultured Draconibacterium sp.]
MSDQEKIDLQKLTQKELLIVMYRDLRSLSSTVEANNKEQIVLRERLAIVETKQKISGLIWGGISGAISSGLVALFFSLFK